MQSATKEVALKEVNLEHVFPRNPSDEWSNKDDLTPYTGHLGNLTMLGERLNAAVANSGVDQKRKYYEKNTELEITKQLAKDNQTWDVAAIQKRAKQLLKTITEVWNFN